MELISLVKSKKESKAINLIENGIDTACVDEVKIIVQNSIEIQCKDGNDKLLADIMFEKRCGFQKLEILSPSGYTIAKQRLHWSSFKLEMQDVCYILKKRSQSPLLIDVVNTQDRSVVAKLFEDLNSSLSNHTELNLSKKDCDIIDDSCTQYDI
ncbi:unnamed protein product [Mytilus coruscus]|uniref:Uncharacterized protein n=1 Tax=Mytilus coruscus TaxID=42192 RepID=A0A6J8EQT8_MYTCO|nr:unnamed protein product [Mytilus coruscus]